MMNYGWVLLENGKQITNNLIEIFKTKEDLFDYYGSALGDLNSIQRVEIIWKQKKKEK